MTYSLTWLPSVLRNAGLKVSECPGWTDRGRGPMSPQIRGVVCHHTGTVSKENMPTLNVLIDGRSDLAGPLAQLGLGRDGTYYVVAAGRCNHAGPGQWKNFSGNSKFIGIEAENSGVAADLWPDVQMDAYRRGAAALLKQIGAEVEMCCGHREYAPGRKDDPLFDMVKFRADVQAIMSGGATVLPLIPAADANGKPTLRRGAKGELVKTIQGRIKIAVDGNFGPGTEAAVRQFQRDAGVVPDGIVGPKTWALLDA